MSVMFPDIVNPADLAYAQFQAAEEAELQRQIIQYREMYEGTLSPTLIAELRRSLLSGTAEEIPGLINYFVTVIDEVLGRVGVVNLTSEPPDSQGFQQANTGQAGVYMEPTQEREVEPGQENGEEPGEESGAEPTQEAGQQPGQGIARRFSPRVEWAMDWWQRTNMDEKQSDLFEHMFVDGEAFIILQPEATGPNEFDVVPYVQRRYTDATAGGDNQGCKVHYRDGRVIMASKRWIEERTEFTPPNVGGRGRKKTKQENFMTLYIAPLYDEEGKLEQKGEILTYQRQSGPSSATSQWGEPIKQMDWPHPLPIIHFRAPKNRSRGKDAAGAQLLMDNFNTSLAVGASLTNLPMLRVLGMYPTIDGEVPVSGGANVWTIKAGAIIGSPEHGPETAEVEWLRPGDLSQTISAIDQTLNHLAITTGTPSLMSQKVRADAAAELIRRIEQRPIAIARQAQIKSGNAFSQMFRVLRVFLQEFANQETPEGEVYPRWQTADTAVTAIAGTEEQPIVTGYEMNAQERIEASK